MASQTPSIRRSAQDDRRLEEGRTGLPAPSPDSVKPNGDDQQQEQPAPLLFVATRVCVGLAFYLTWLPYVLLIILRERRTYEALIFGVALHCFALVFNLALKLTQQKREWPYMLDGIFAVYFIIFLAIYQTKQQYQDDLAQWQLVVVHVWLCFGMLVSIAVRQPFTLQYAREVAPEEAWNSESFRSVCDHISGVWAGVMGMNGLLCVAPVETGKQHYNDALNIVFNYLWPLLTLVLLFVGTRYYPGLIRRMFFIPRRDKNAVRPEGAPATAGASGTAPPGGPSAAATNTAASTNNVNNTSGVTTNAPPPPPPPGVQSGVRSGATPAPSLPVQPPPSSRQPSQYSSGQQQRSGPVAPPLRSPIGSQAGAR